MNEVYKGIWDCFRIRMEDKYNKNPLGAILPSEILELMSKVENEHLREEIDEFVAYVAQRRVEEGFKP